MSKFISFSQYGLIIALAAFSSTAFAEYYVVYAAPPQNVYIAPTTVVSTPAPCRVPCHVPCKKVKKVRHYCKRHYAPVQPTCPAPRAYSRQSCNMSVYYSVPTCNPCVNNSVWVQGPAMAEPNFVVNYGAPVYPRGTYHTVEEYSWYSDDMRTADDIDW